MTIQDMLRIAVAQEASDLHIIPGTQPFFRLHGDLTPVADEAIIDQKRAEELILPLLSQEQKDQLLVNKEVDFSYQFEQLARFRVNTYYTKGVMAAELRLIPVKIKTIEELKLPQIFHQFSALRQGFVLVTGPTGQGKSSTLAAIIEEINAT